MKQSQLSNSELIVNEDGSIYHLNLRPGDIADTIILVGDPQRATDISQRFDSVELCKQKREFITYTGIIGNKPLSVIGTGMSGGNIDIAINELDALVNIDFDNRVIKPTHHPLKLIRLGTTGALSSKVPLDSLVVSDYACGFDGLLLYYQYDFNEKESQLMEQFKRAFAEIPTVGSSYVCQAASSLSQSFSQDYIHGITLTCSGFYGPQGRHLRASLISNCIFECAEQIAFDGLTITNLEMETAIIYGLSRLLGHESCSISTVIANRETKKISNNLKKSVNNMIDTSFELALSL